MNMWNIKDLPEPPINTYQAENKKIDIKHLYDVFQEGKQFFDDNKFMYAEYAVLSRVVYRMKQKFRSAKDFKALQKINKALDNYFKMDIPRNLKNFMDLIPTKYKQVTYLPTKNLLDYILVRLQGCVKLMERIVETCKIAAYLLDKRMHTGHFWKIAFITFSITSRIYILAKYIAKFVCEFYSKLIPFSSQLDNTSRCSPRYTFPRDLKEWMNVDWLEVDDEIQIIEMPTEIPEIIQFFDLVDNDDDEVQFCDEYFIIKDEDDEEVEKNLKKIGKMDFKNLWELRGFDTREDVGEVIEINDSMQMLDKNSVSEKAFNGKNDVQPSLEQNDSKINVSSNTDNDDVTVVDNSQFVDNIDAARGDSKLQQENENLLIISDNSTQFEDSNIVADGGVSNFISRQENPKTLHMTEEETVTITIPDTPLVVKSKRKKIKNGRNEDKLKADIDSSAIKSEEDTVISLSDSEIINDELVKKSKKLKTKKPKRKGSTNMQSSSSLTNISVKLDENSFSKTRFKSNNNIKRDDFQTNILSRTSTDIFDDSVQFVDSNIDADGGFGSLSQQRKPKTFTVTKEETATITVPDTPLVNREENRVKNKPIKKLEMGENKFKPDINLDSNVFQIHDDAVILLSDTSLTKKIDEKPVKKKKWKPKKPKQNSNANTQSSVIHTAYKQPMKKKKKIVKPNQNENSTRFNEVKSNAAKKKKKAKKNNQNEGQIDNNQSMSRNIFKKLSNYQTFIANLNSDSFYIQDKKLPDQTPKSSRIRKQDRKLNNTGSAINLNNSGGQQSGTESMGTPSTSNSKKRKIETGGENVKVKKLKESISNDEKTKRILQRKLSLQKAISDNEKRRRKLQWKLSETQRNLKKLSGEVSPMRESERIVTNEIVRSNKKRNMQKKPMKTVTKSRSNVPKIKKKIIRESNRSSDHVISQTKQNLNRLSGEFSAHLSPMREIRIDTAKLVKSKEKRKMRKKKQKKNKSNQNNAGI